MRPFVYRFIWSLLNRKTGKILPGEFLRHKFYFETIATDRTFNVHSIRGHKPVAPEIHHFILNLPHKVYLNFFYKNTFMLLL